MLPDLCTVQAQNSLAELYHFSLYIYIVYAVILLMLMRKNVIASLKGLKQLSLGRILLHTVLIRQKSLDSNEHNSAV